MKKTFERVATVEERYFTLDGELFKAARECDFYLKKVLVSVIKLSEPVDNVLHYFEGDLK